MKVLDEHRFLDNDGRLTQWPSKKSDKQLVIAYLAGKFQHGVAYGEPAVNIVLKNWHTFSDWSLLRRELFERGFFDRNTGGTNYHLAELSTSMSELVLVRPNVERDAALGVKWLEGEEGRTTLLLMGNTDRENKPSTIAEEEQRVRGFITSEIQETWMILHDGAVVGAIWLDLEGTEYLAAPSIHIMIGHPDIRGKGFGFAAMEALIKNFEKRDHKEYLYSRHLLANEAVTKLFLKVGFIDHEGSYQDSDGLSWQNVRYKLQR
jgi:GNAT superfamily N-acetyltransferase